MSVGAYQIEAPGKHSGFGQSQKEPCSKETAIAGYQTLADGDQPKPEHTEAQPDIRFEFLEQDVARDLEPVQGLRQLLPNSPLRNPFTNKIYGGKKTTSAVEYCILVMSRSSRSSKTAAFAIFVRSRKAIWGIQ